MSIHVHIKPKYQSKQGAQKIHGECKERIANIYGKIHGECKERITNIYGLINSFFSSLIYTCSKPLRRFMSTEVKIINPIKICAFK